MNATNLITVFGLSFDDASEALEAMGFQNADTQVLRAIWVEGVQYWEQPCTLRRVHNETVLVRNLLLPVASVLDTETLRDFYIVEGRTLDGTRRLYAVRFEAQDNGPAAETWTELHTSTARTTRAIDDEGDERHIIIARTESGTLHVAVTGYESASAFYDYAATVLWEERKV